MNQEVKDELDLRGKLLILKLISSKRNVSKECKEFGIAKSSFYVWKKKYESGGIEELRRKKPIPKSHPKQLPQEVVNKILELREEYKLGPQRIAWYLERYHGITTSCSTVYRTLVRNNQSKLPKSAPRRAAIRRKRYQKSVTGHHVQVDVKFIWLMVAQRGRVHRFQYKDIDDAPRIRALKIYERHTQKNAIAFIDYVIEKFPFRIHTIRTDRGHEFQAQFHWYVEDKVMQHTYIKPKSPN